MLAFLQKKTYSLNFFSLSFQTLRFKTTVTPKKITQKVSVISNHGKYTLVKVFVANIAKIGLLKEEGPSFLSGWDGDLIIEEVEIKLYGQPQLVSRSSTEVRSYMKAQTYFRWKE